MKNNNHFPEPYEAPLMAIESVEAEAGFAASVNEAVTGQMPVNEEFW